MAITYPLPPPYDVIAPERVSFQAYSVISESRNPFTLRTIRSQFDGDIWTANVELPPLTLEQYKAWYTFLLSAQRANASFWLWDPTMAGKNQGALSGTPVLDTHQAGSQTLYVRGVPGPVTLWAKAGDHVEVDGRLHVVLKDAYTVSGGSVAVDVWPRLKGPALDGTPVVVTNPKCLMRLDTSTQPYIAEKNRTYTINFSCEEAI